MHKVVVIGAGFGGLAAARSLSDQEVEVTLVDQRNFHTFLPLLYEVATAGLDPGDVAYPVRAVIGRTPNIRFRLGTVTGIVWEERMVCFNDTIRGHDSSAPGCEDDVPYDSLILASGAIANFFGIPGAAEYTFPLYTLEDARHLRDHLLLRLEEADGELAHGSDGTLNFVVVGGGPTGVEVSGAIAELLDMSMERDGFHFDRSMARVVLVDGLGHLLGPFKNSAQHYAEETLSARSVELALGKMVARITPTEVELSDGTVIATRTVIWAGGVTVHGTVATALGTPTAHNGRLVVDSTLEVSGLPGVFAIGDCAAIPVSLGSEFTCPQLAQVAIQSGHHAAAQIMAGLTGRLIAPFSYRDKGIMATIGRRAAVAELRNGLVLRGTLGWIAWFSLHLVYLVGFRNKMTVFVNWWWRYLNWTSGPRVIFSSEPGVEVESGTPTRE
jgi:NADH dehydrogenase